MTQDVCQDSCAHKETVAQVVSRMPAIDKLYDLAELFKMLGDSTRVRILSALSFGELCVCDLSEALSMGQTAVSHQLRLLRGARLVRSRREGKNVYYALDDDHVTQIFTKGFEHIDE